MHRRHNWERWPSRVSEVRCAEAWEQADECIYDDRQGWLRGEKLKYAGATGYTDLLKKNQSTEKLSITKYHQKSRQFEEELRKARSKSTVTIDLQRPRESLEKVSQLQNRSAPWRKMPASNAKIEICSLNIAGYGWIKQQRTSLKKHKISMRKVLWWDSAHSLPSSQTKGKLDITQPHSKDGCDRHEREVVS